MTHINHDRIGGTTMKEFDIELAKAGHPVCTREGMKSRIVCWDFKGFSNKHILALIEKEDDTEDVVAFNDNGSFMTGGISELDLMMAPVEHEGWVNICRYGGWLGTSVKVYQTKEDAIKDAVNDKTYIGTTKIEWEED